MKNPDFGFPGSAHNSQVQLNIGIVLLGGHGSENAIAAGVDEGPYPRYAATGALFFRYDEETSGSRTGAASTLGPKRAAG